MTTFELPISTRQKIDPHIINDLGLKESYNKLLQPSTQFGKNTIDMWTKQYTDDKEYLKTCKNWKDAACKLDNNNGVLFIYIDDSLTIKYCFYNPKQAETGIKEKSLRADQYIKSYCSNKDIAADKEFAKELKVLMKTDFIDLMSVEYPRFWD